MIISKEDLVDLQEKYEKVKKLIEEDSKLDPETEPFLSRYAARNILISMNANLENLLRSQREDSQEHSKLIGMLGTVQLTLGVVSIDTEELSAGEKHLAKCKEIIEKYELKPEVAYVNLNLHNQFGLLLSKNDPEKAQKCLEEAEKFYFTCKELDISPIDPADLFICNLEFYNEQRAKEKFEKLYTLTLYYLAQIHGAFKNDLKSSVYCHVTLKRQLESKDYDPIDWALNSATLSQFFMEKNGFKQARHHLAASSYILDLYENELKGITELNHEYDAKMETFKHRSADVARCWAKYGLILMISSKERLLQHTDDIDSKCSATTDLGKLISSEHDLKIQDLQNLFFPCLDVTGYEEKITDKFLLTLEDARKVFNNVQDWLAKAHGYYMIDTLASDYIEIVQDQSQAYENLVFFDESPQNQTKLYKRAADLLENVLRQVNPTYYLQYCRQMWFKLGVIYSDTLDIKLDKLKETDERPTPHALLKVNNLIEKSVRNFQCFIDSFRNTKNEIPKVIVEDMRKPYLQAHFHIGAMHGRCITLDKGIQLKNCEASLKAYQTVRDYCEEHPESSELIPEVMGVVQEMTRLLPMKILKLEYEIQHAQ